jgi:hypothetical protein
MLGYEHAQRPPLNGFVQTRFTSGSEFAQSESLPCAVTGDLSNGHV